MKLELKHLAPYLPYGLNLKYEQEGDVRKLVYLDLQSPDRIGMNVKPLLYPLSYLTKEITVDGKTFVPMVELAKLSLDTDKPFQLHDRRLEAITRHSSINYPNAVYKTFSFTKDESSFTVSVLDSDFKTICCYSVAKQLQLFQKLYEWHFDLENLIEQNLAIEKTTIKQ